MTESTQKFRDLFKAATHGLLKGSLRSITSSFIREVQREVSEWQPLTITKENDYQPRYQVLDFFCGCGGMSMGFSALSRVIPLTEIVGGCDINKDALTTFQKNFAVPGINIDVRDLVDNDRALSEFLDLMPRYDRNRPTILIGCAPCQGFTSHRKKHWHQDDHRNTLIGAFTSIAVKLNPECIVMENVPEMLSKKYWSHFENARAILNEAGYVVSQSIYNAASFGVPQDRFRALVIAMRKPFLLPYPLNKDILQYKTVRDAIGNLPPVSAGEVHTKDPMHRSAAHRKSTLDTIRAIPKDGGNRPTGIGPKCLDRVCGFSDVYGRLAWDRPAITITHYARNPASGRFVHPEQDRGLTMREAALIQGFPKGFEFCGTFDSVFKQIGEAVPPMFSAAIAASCLIELLSESPVNDEYARVITPITEPVSSSFSSVISGLKKRRNDKCG